jgi:Zn-dependent metalloprotease
MIKKFVLNYAVLTFCLFFLCFISKAQDNNLANRVKNSESYYLKGKLKNIDNNGWIWFSSLNGPKSGEIFSLEHKELIGFGIDDEMKLSEEWKDEIGIVHKKYQQYYKGIEVYGNELTEHIKNGKVYLLHGKIVTDLHIDTKNIISLDFARNFAIEHIGAQKYAFQDKELEKDLKKETGDSTATHFPSGKLYISTKNAGNLNNPNDYVVTWSFEVRALEPVSFAQIFINAKNLEIESDLSLVHSISGNPNCNNGTGQTVWFGFKDIDTEWKGGFHNDWILKATDCSRNVHTKRFSSNKSTYGGSFNKLDEMHDDDNKWDNFDAAEIRGHWSISTTWDYFKSKFNRNGVDNLGTKIKIVTNTSSTSISGQRIASYFHKDRDIIFEYEKTKGKNTVVMPTFLDVAAHEFTHGITASTSKLIPKGESGALNESFSDIFGETIERTTFNSGSWQMGEDLPFANRNFENPALSLSANCSGSIGLPDTYQGNFWTDPTSLSCDAGGIHGNCSVQNKWYYLLFNGGVQNGIAIQGIGIDKASKIAFRNLTIYLLMQSNFQDSRIGSIQAAKDLFGNCSNEVVQTTNAWAAVGVGNIWTDFISSEDNVGLCPNFLPAIITAKTCNPSKMSWDIPTDWKATVNMISPTISQLIIDYIPIGSGFVWYSIPISSSSGASTFANINWSDDCSVYQKTIKTPKYSDVNINLLYPNPTSNTIKIEINETSFESGKLQIFDSTSRLIDEKYLNSTSVNLDLSDFSSGIYWIKILSEYSSSKPYKIIKF